MFLKNSVKTYRKRKHRNKRNGNPRHKKWPYFLKQSVKTYRKRNHRNKNKEIQDTKSAQENNVLT
jgi:hypothetical protein